MNQVQSSQRVAIADPLPLNRLYEFRFADLAQERREQVWQVISNDVERRLGNPRSILDPAAGRGEFIRSVAAQEKWAVDLTAGFDLHQSGVRFLMGNALDVKLPDNYFDAVFISNFLEHLQSPEEACSLLKRMQAALKPGGRIAILGPNFKYTFREYFDFCDHRLALTERSVEELLHLSGFEVHEAIPRYLPYSFKSKLPSHPLLVSAYLKVPLLWRFFGRQFLLIARKVRNKD